MKAIIDVPDSALLSTNKLTDLIGSVTGKIGIASPDVVCLPMIDFGGANYDSRKIDRNDGPWSQYNLRREIETIRSQYGAKVYVSIIASLDFINSSVFLVRDQHGDDKTGVCIVNPHIQRLLREAIAEAIEKLRPDGIVLDMCDINGQNARDGRIHVTCFCPYCIAALKNERFDYSELRGHPNPTNLVLKDSGDSIQHFTFDCRNQSESELVAQSRANDIFDGKWIDCDQKASEWARSVLRYAVARSRIHAEAVRQIGAGFREQGIRMAAVICSPRFDWTSGVDLSHLEGCVDEVWTNTGDLTPTEVPAGVEVYHYLFARARYMIDAYFELASAPDRLLSIAAGLTTARADVRELLKSRSHKLLRSSEVKLSNVSAIGAMGAFAGYVAPPLAEEFMKRIGEEVLRFLPAEEQRDKTAGAAEVILYLMRLAEQGTPLTMDVLRKVAQGLGVFERE